MSTVVVVGAAGKIGRHLVRLLLARGDVPRGVVRTAEQVAELEAAGAEAVLFDVEAGDAASLAASLTGVDAVVFAAGAGPGSGPERKQTVDLGGSVLLADAATAAGVRRYVQISAAGIETPAGPDADPSWAAYVDAKARADEHLRGTDLDWTILRPGPLGDGPGSGRVTLTTEPGGGHVEREDVAALVLACLDEASSIGCQWYVTGGEGEPVDGAVQDAARAAAAEG
ncbi:SDR family oxidoreductase [Cellulomonas marina]|uniref:Nucleoside-diphosphate-sugar epimerase n=1 Tax=Cellulomonas marina TaxID=988821 RepID=A0A1I1AQH1_9CELL|nr:SDR family oxidoreductase [Cellulomonas marina]GIG30804.1 NAD-dependent dehydratase [Cellulomonas marina]SFB38600.1 Nucleoside-diphosphate-sugar epimerase [Cellulomonas marina]